MNTLAVTLTHSHSPAYCVGAVIGVCMSLSVIHWNVDRQQHLTIPTWENCYKRTAADWLYIEVQFTLPPNIFGMCYSTCKLTWLLIHLSPNMYISKGINQSEHPPQPIQPHAHILYDLSTVACVEEQLVSWADQSASQYNDLASTYPCSFPYCADV